MRRLDWFEPGRVNGRFGGYDIGTQQSDSP